MLCLRKEVERRFERDIDSNCPPGKRFITSEGSSWGADVGTGGILKSKPLGLLHKVRCLLSVVSKETEI